MERAIDLSELDDVLSEVTYPADRGAVTDRIGDTTLRLADGRTTIADVLANAGADRFDSADDLANAIRSNLPREAVGEPYQSEGEG